MTGITLSQLELARFPDEAARLLAGAPLYDSSCSAEARVIFIDRDGGMFLKTAAAGTLRTEAEMTAYYHALGLGAEVLLYCTEGAADYLATRSIPGANCTDREYLSDPKRLCDTTATLLRALHETPCALCPVDRIASYADSVRRGLDGSCYEPELFAPLWEFASFAEAEAAALEGLSALKGEALIHGDYCLPNIILRDWRLSGFIDLGNGGIGDRHIDLLWGVWTLNFNLKTTAWTDRFLDAYGRDRIEPEKLRAIAAMEMIGG